MVNKDVQIHSIVSYHIVCTTP